MRTNTIIINGHTYINPDPLTFGDYGGYGSYGKANILTVMEEFEDSMVATSFCDLAEIERASMFVDPDFLEMFLGNSPPKLIHVEGDWSSEAAYLLADDEMVKVIIEALEQYPSLDDDKVSEIELEWEDEAWEWWLKDELLEAAFPDPDERERVDELDEDVLWDAYRDAMEATNTYPEAELNGVHVRVDDIAAAFRERVLQAITAPA